MIEEGPYHEDHTLFASLCHVLVGSPLIGVVLFFHQGQVTGWCCATKKTSHSVYIYGTVISTERTLGYGCVGDLS